MYHKTGESFITPHVGPAPIDETGEEGSVDLDEESEEYEESEEDDDIFDEGGEEEKEPNFIFYSCLLRNRVLCIQTGLVMWIGSTSQSLVEEGVLR